MPDQSTVKKKNANIEFLRLMSLSFVVFAHLLDKGGGLADVTASNNPTPYVAWLIESFVVVCINVFMLISGYYLVNSRFRLGRLIEIVFAAVFYSAGAFIVCLLAGVVSLEGADVYSFLDKIFPIHMNLYWFITGYVIIYMASPLLNKGLKALSEKQLRLVLLLFLLYECVLKSILPVRLSTDMLGYSTFWMFIVYMAGAYIRLHGLKMTEKPSRALLIYVISSVAVFAENVIIMFISAKFGRLKELHGVALEHNHIFLFIGALGLFGFFLNKKPMKEGLSKIVLALSPMALGIYLIHENMSVRYKWPGWLGLTEMDKLSPPLFLIKLIYGVLFVVIAGLLVDFIRIRLVELIRKLTKKSKLTAAMKRFDRAINGEE